MSPIPGYADALRLACGGSCDSNGGGFIGGSQTTEFTISYQTSGRCDVIAPASTIGDTNHAGAFAVSFAVSTADRGEPTADPDQVSILSTLSRGS
ncbi:MAG: hypothetical protein CME47_09290 [Halieaceae bacterium]|nr:hypothetical protein [Halieaceae bacterium]